MADQSRQAIEQILGNLTPPPQVCSPVHRCFPPQPTICLICDATDPKDCPFKEKTE